MKILYEHTDRANRNQAYREFADGEHWQRVMVDYPQAVRWQAANLAAHNWNVIDAGDRLLIASAWSGGHWWDKDGTKTPLTDEELDKFYPRIVRPDYDTASREEIRAWENGAGQNNGNKFRRVHKIVLDT